jgi:RNA polymerase sigma-70 factor (ECF subfamily)
MTGPPSETAVGRAGGRETPFLTTRWSVVLTAGRGSGPDSRRALAELCETYWYPLYAYVRRRGHRAEDAQDLTQAFFTRLLEKKAVEAADPRRGRFRAFLLASLKNFLANEWNRERAQKRGGGRTALSLDFEAADARFVAEPRDDLTPDRAYERSWALAVLDRALARLATDHAERGRSRLFERLEGTLVAGGPRVPYRELAVELGMTEGAVKVAVHRLRASFREVLRREVSHTVGGPEELEAELQDLIAALAAD